jgi:iron complex outermembrane receptor protein
MNSTAKRGLLLASTLLLVALTPACGALAQTPRGEAVPPTEDLTDGGNSPGAAASETAHARATEVADIVVTARRESEKARDIPVSLSAVPAKVLQQTGAYTLADVQTLVPSMVAFQLNPRNASIGIRGIGVSFAADGLDTTVGVYVDGVYLGRPGMALEDLIDIDQVEVLRGPQGTLFGRNAAAGALNITTRAPTFTPELMAEGSYGNYNYLQARLSVSGPLVPDVLAARLTAFTSHRDGVLPNFVSGMADNSIGRSGARLQFLYTPTPKLRFRIIGEASAENDTCCVGVLRSVLPASLSTSTASTLAAFNALGYTPRASTAYAQTNSPQDMLTDQRAASVEADYDLGWGRITSITAYRYWDFHPLQDGDGTPLDIIHLGVAQTKDEQLSEELRLASNPGPFSWQAGLFIFNQALRDHFIFSQFGTEASAFYSLYNHFSAGAPLVPGVVAAPGSQYIIETHAVENSEAIFAQANYEILHGLTLTGGVRYTYEYKHGITDTYNVGTPLASSAIQFHDNAGVAAGNVSGVVSGAYRLTPKVLAYVSYSTGYQAPGLNLNAAPVPGTPIVLQSENVSDIEGGIKSTWFHDQLVLNVDVFSEYLTGLQATIVPPGFKPYLANVGDIRSVGVEAEADWRLTNGLTLSANGSYDHARYTSYPNAPPPAGEPVSVATQNLTGRPVFEAPEWIANVIGRYEWEVGGVRPYVQMHYSYRSSAYGDVQDSPGALIPAYSLLDARIGAQFGRRYDLSVWIENALGAVYFQTLGVANMTGTGAFGFSGVLGAPRTFGATFRAEL